MMFETGHAVVVTSWDGAEVLIHVGLDTVKLKGTYFTVCSQNGHSIRKGDPLIEFDMTAIASEGYDLISPIVVTNYENYEYMNAVTVAKIAEGDEFIRLSGQY
jgi:PTS system beta-glucosides-specific IIC component